MDKLLDDAGKEACLGSTSYWLADDDFVSTAASVSDATKLGSLGFPRDWPGVYTSSKVLKSLIGKKGVCAGKKTAVVSGPTDEELALVAGVELRPLQCFANATRVGEATGMSVVCGWAVHEHLDMAVSEAFVAERHWWNALEDGRWVDFTPRPNSWPDLLLAEAAHGAPKSQAELDARGVEVAAYLFRQRFDQKVALAVSTRAVVAEEIATPGASAAEPSTAGANTQPQQAEPAEWSSPADLRTLVKRIRSGDKEAVTELLSKVKGNEQTEQQTCLLIVKDGVAKPLVQMLSGEPLCEDALRFMLVLTDAGVCQKTVGVQQQFMAAGAGDVLLSVLKGGSDSARELAAAMFGNLSHESPQNQDALASIELFEALTALLSQNVACATEAAYAIWNLCVGHTTNSTQVVKCGGVPLLVNLLTSDSDIAQENAAGALMHITMTEQARTPLVKAKAIPALCKLLLPSSEAEVSTQAAGALLNIASDSAQYARMIVQEDAVGPLIKLLKDGPSLASEYAAGALMNILKATSDVPEEAAKLGAIPALATLLSKGLGQSEALGALANLASASPERQATIYKAQVTRKSVALLSDKDLDIRRSAVSLIMNLSPHAKIKERIVEAGALPPLVKLLPDADSDVRERAAGALANLFNDHSDNVHKAVKQAPGIIVALIDLLKDSSTSYDGRAQGAHALAMIAAEDGLCDQVWSAGAGPPILAMLEAGVPEGALGVMNLCWRWPEVKEQLANENAVPLLLTMLNTGETHGKEYAAGALMNMTAGSVASAELAAGAVPALTEMLRSDNTQAAEWSAGALANIVRAGPHLQQAAVGAGAAANLAALLHRATPSGKSLVLLALISLADGESGKAVSVQRALSGAKEKAKLKSLKADGANKEVQEYTSALLEKVDLTV